MLGQIIADTLVIVRRPTADSFRAAARPQEGLALFYYLMSSLAALLLSFLGAYLYSAERAIQREQMLRLYGDGLLTSIIDLNQNPVSLAVYWLAMVPVTLGLWFYLPYWIGTRLGGATDARRAFIYVVVLCWVPITLLNSALSVAMGGALSGLFLPVSIILDFLYAYCLFSALRAIVRVPTGKAILAVLAPIAVFSVVMVAFVVAIVITLVGRLAQ